MPPRKPKLKAQLGKLRARHGAKPAASTAGVPAGKNGLSQAAVATKGADAASAEKKPKRITIPFTAEDTILLVGEGNFSFSLGLASVLGTGDNIVATAYDSEEVVKQKYPDAEGIIHDLVESFNAAVMYDVDATALDKAAALKGRTFSKIVFNFPHVGLGIKDQDRNIRANQALILKFLQSSMALSTLKTEIVLTTKTGGPYDLWDVKRLAKSAGLVSKMSFPFHPDPYPGYEHRRTLGHEEGVSADANAEIKNAKTFVLTTASDELMEKITGIKASKRKNKGGGTAGVAAAPASKKPRKSDEKDDD
ncbi:hypothetical protein AMAG_00881 [Allomyces macrogynus ATCC 38327]|uniref:25S rRNA (uridine-N(3))-methyltransferase BMT5-like domain-containing protein n=1 Tax=Allomyces macrogynus (strain ATCC 38327) TaxID=578462 RepID=A0A0L0RX68_ALLM3|nr:hypothetical protein AMAG_00881 [Allomyces macrogynus ATCC 38327]|eukprot:KNE54938.1 hypothetical protein AMAG_00881 [Allomyces macrogynus ATCC 38327]